LILNDTKLSEIFAAEGVIIVKVKEVREIVCAADIILQ
jgi:hypothetical protein